MTEVISVRFRGGCKNYDFSPNGLTLKMGEEVVVETAQGLEFATCTVGNHEVEDSAVVLAQGDGVCRLDYTPVPGHYSGAGDSFTALFTGNILNGNPPAKSARLAADTLCQWIDRYRQRPAPITGLPVERLWE